MNKGYTLIELLGVIILLSILIVLITPNVINAIKKSHNEKNNYTSNMIYNAVDSYIRESDKFEAIENNTYCIKISELTDNGYLDTPVIYNDGNIENNMSVEVTYTTNWNYNIVDNNTCITNSNYICTRVESSTNGFIPSGNYLVGEEYRCKLNDTDYSNFYIISTNGSKVNLISKDKLPNTSIWYTERTNSKGPVDAFEYISNSTSSWSNIPDLKNFSSIDTVNSCSACGYKGIFSNTNKTSILGKNNETYIFNNLKARLPIYNEVTDVGCTTENNSCPLWLGSDFYLANSANGLGGGAYYITSTRKIDALSVNVAGGIKVVIEVNKNNLE